MREPKERIIYNNYDLEALFPDEEMIELLIENGNEREDITDAMISEIRYENDAFDWECNKDELESFFADGKFIAMGSVGRWDGTYKAGTIFDKFADFFYKATDSCDYIKLYDCNGHFYLQCSHHDGTNLYEIKRLTDKGIQYLENWEYGTDKRTMEYAHTQIFNKYSVLPRYAEKVFGCKKTEYVTNKN